MKAHLGKLQILVEEDKWFQFVNNLCSCKGVLTHKFEEPHNQCIDVPDYRGMEVDFKDWLP